MRSIKELMLELVSVQSDTGTVKERAMAEKIHSLVRESPYFVEHPECCGVYENGDILRRPVVWALRKGSGKRTVILEGHYDAVEIESYGILKPYALSPVLLKEKMRSMQIQDEELDRDLRDDRWCFGRGVADMKSGLAINLHALFTHPNEAVIILFVAVPDEENISAGALQAVELFERLKDRYALDYRLSIITEPQNIGIGTRQSVQLIQGSMGKFLPVILAKGVLAHSADLLNGLNSALILSEIVRGAELRTDMVSEDDGVFTQPPTTLLMRDLKTTYDVSIPEYSAACLNILFLNNKRPMAILEDLRRICSDALTKAIAAYDKAFDTMKGKGFIEESCRRRFKGDVVLMTELEARLRSGAKDYELFKEALDARLVEEIRAGGINLQTASIHYMKAILEKAQIMGPVVVIGIAPPYYLAVNNKYIEKDIGDCLDGLGEYMASRHAVTVEPVPYLSGMTDMSYLSCACPREDRQFLENLSIPRSAYDVPVERIARLNIPSLMIGPGAKCIHQAGERVYLPDVLERIPDVIGRIIERL